MRLTCEQPEIVSLVWNDYILIFGLLCGFIGLDVRLTKEEPFKLNKEQNTDLKKSTHIEAHSHTIALGFPLSCTLHC